MVFQQLVLLVRFGSREYDNIVIRWFFSVHGVHGPRVAAVYEDCRRLGCDGVAEPVEQESHVRSIRFLLRTDSKDV